MMTEQLPTHDKFITIVADPPWKYSEKMNMGIYANDHRGPEHRYDCMTLQEIKQLPVAEMTDKNAHLYLWTTNTFMIEAHEVANDWGFTVRSILTWIKPRIGLGYFFRNATEHVLFGVKGKLPTKRKDVKTWFDYDAPAKHSVKPDRFLTLVESMSPGPYLELFSRRNRRGWTCWGKSTEGLTANEVKKKARKGLF